MERFEVSDELAERIGESRCLMLSRECPQAGITVDDSDCVPRTEAPTEPLIDGEIPF